MGKATKWLRGLFGTKKGKETTDRSPPTTISSAHAAKEKRRWSFSKPGRDSLPSPMNIPSNVPDDNTWRRSYLAQTEQQQQQNKHAIAVAAATAAAADAAVAAAQAAVAVVRLTNQGRGALFSGGLEQLAAVKIQNFFRGYLARKALRALKGLVKLQALVRGYLVRRRTAATLHSMQALLRAQASVRFQRARRRISKDNRSLQPRRSMERYDEARNEFHSRRLSAASVENAHNAFDESPKIVEIDTFSRPRSRSRSRRIQTAISEYGGEDPYYCPTVSSPLPCPVPGRLSIPESRQLQDFEWVYNGGGDECRGASTTQSTPRFTNSWRSNAPPTPARSVCGDSFFRAYSNFPSYMANTQSFCAKLRSQSAPKQRAEQLITAATANVSGSKKRVSLNEMMSSRNSFSGVRINRPSSAQFHQDSNS